MNIKKTIEDDEVKARKFHVEWLEKSLENAASLKECIEIYWNAFSVSLFETAVKAFEEAYQRVDSFEEALILLDCGPDDEDEIDFIVAGVNFDIRTYRKLLTCVI